MAYGAYEVLWIRGRFSGSLQIPPEGWGGCAAQRMDAQ